MNFRKIKFKLVIMSVVILVGISSTALGIPSNPGEDISRIYGNDRFETANKIADEFCKPNNQLPIDPDGYWNYKDTAKEKVDTIILANGFNFPDAVCSTPLTKIYNAPILLTHENNLTPSTAKQIKKMKIKNVVIVGGEGVVTKTVENQLKDIGISKIERYGGQDRYETSLLIAKKVNENSPINYLGIVSGNNWVNALTEAPMCARYNVPILLVPNTLNNDSLPKMKDFIANAKESVINRNNGKDVDLTYIVAGTEIDEISDDILKYLGKYVGDTYFRDLFTISDNVNNATTNILISDAGLIKHADNVVVTCANVFADSLSVSALAAKINAPIVVYGKGDNQFASLDDELTVATGQLDLIGYADAKDYINKMQHSLGIDTVKNIKLIGGEAVLPQKSIEKIRCAW